MQVVYVIMLLVDMYEVKGLTVFYSFFLKRLLSTFY
jgi:hypothetical protein